jgi:hypothetical protein
MTDHQPLTQEERSDGIVLGGVTCRVAYMFASYPAWQLWSTLRKIGSVIVWARPCAPFEREYCNASTFVGFGSAWLSQRKYNHFEMKVTEHLDASQRARRDR